MNTTSTTTTKYSRKNSRFMKDVEKYKSLLRTYKKFITVLYSYEKLLAE